MARWKIVTTCTALATYRRLRRRRGAVREWNDRCRFVNVQPL